MTAIDLGGVDGKEFLRQFASKVKAAENPLAVSIELTERCNLRCVHCYLGDQEALRGRRREELTTDQWIWMLERIAESGCLKLLMTGGDPLLRPDFATLYRHARRLGLLVTVFTNGTLVTDRIVELFRELPPFGVEVSVYGVSRATYEGITGIPGSYDACMDGIERLKSSGCDLGLKTVLMRPNRQEFPAIAAFCREHGTRRFRFDTAVQGAFDGSESSLQARLTPDEAVAAEFSDRERAEGLARYFTERLKLKPRNPERLYACGAGRTGYHVNPYGRIQPCLSVRHITADPFVLGLSTALGLLRADLAGRAVPAGSRCAGCESRLICESCPAFSMLEGGREDEAAGFQCRMTQRRVQMVRMAETI